MKTAPFIHAAPLPSLWQSAADEAVSRKTGLNTMAPADHPVVAGARIHAQHMRLGKAMKPPDGSVSTDDPQLHAYLSFLNHRHIHAILAGDKALENQIAKQRKQFVFGQPEWEEQWIYYFWYYFQYPFHKGQSPLYRSWKSPAFGKSNPNYGVIDWKIPADATVALVGDVGIGTDTAAAVLAGALSFKPDVILHVGDVYYSGTTFEFDHRFTSMYLEVCKATGHVAPLFTIPGNHEYFNGNVGFFHCLDSNRLVQTPQQRQDASFFCLRSADGGWQFLAMDTGFHGHYMDVSITDQQAALDILLNKKVSLPADPTDKEWPTGYNPHFKNCREGNLKVADMDSNPAMITIRRDELAWHDAQLKRFKGRTVLLSHHQVLSANQRVGVAQKTIRVKGKTVPDPADVNRSGINTALWAQFGKYMGDHVAAWFWGHEHNLVVFEDHYVPPDWAGSRTPLARRYAAIPLARCIGHGAVPVQDKEKPYVDTNGIPLDAKAPELGVHTGFYSRGFQMLKLAGKGKPIQVDYYQVSEKDLSISKLFSEPCV